jgi:hypothetical protein
MIIGGNHNSMDKETILTLIALFINSMIGVIAIAGVMRTMI